MALHLECLQPPARRLAAKLFPRLADFGFVMAGGTALALQIGHRVSVDFDFFCAPDRYPRNLLKHIATFVKEIQSIQDQRDTLDVLVEGTKLSFFSYPYPFSPNTEIFESMHLASVIDIAAMKVIAVSQRGAKKDFVDLYAVLQREPLKAILANMAQRFDYAALNPLHIGKALAYFADADHDPEPVYFREAYVWTDIKGFFRDHAREFTEQMITVFSEPSSSDP